MIEVIEAESEGIDWNSGGKVHNWKNHVPQQIRKQWAAFSRLQRIEPELYTLRLDYCIELQYG